MTLLIGIDEAGYGPLLGPLVVSGTFWRVPDEKATGCVWKELGRSCCRATQRAGARVVIDDSKKLYNRVNGLGALERGVLATVGLWREEPENWQQFLRCVAPGYSGSSNSLPWYDVREMALPFEADRSAIRTACNAIRHEGNARDVHCVGAVCEVFDEREFNRLVRATRNKAVVVFLAVSRIIAHALRVFDDVQVAVTVDRLGGREHYREPLARAFPDFDMNITEEAATCSAYRLSTRRRTVDIRFVTEGDGRHLPVALASMYSKYVREGFMRLFNAHWAQHDPELKPTAGYFADARRWLHDAAPMLNRLRIDEGQMLRER